MCNSFNWFFYLIISSYKICILCVMFMVVLCVLLQLLFSWKFIDQIKTWNKIQSSVIQQFKISTHFFSWFCFKISVYLCLLIWKTLIDCVINNVLNSFFCFVFRNVKFKLLCAAQIIEIKQNQIILLAENCSSFRCAICCILDYYCLWNCSLVGYATGKTNDGLKPPHYPWSLNAQLKTNLISIACSTHWILSEPIILQHFPTFLIFLVYKRNCWKLNSITRNANCEKYRLITIAIAFKGKWFVSHH